MGRDKLAELREEWYSEPDKKPETIEEEVDDELLALNILFKSRGVTVAGEDSVKVEKEDAGDDVNDSAGDKEDEK
ncbi:MAG: hypothetical protein ACR2PB_14690 [Desulfocapsaceae bacterium]